VVGAHHGDVAVYIATAALILLFKGFAVAHNPDRAIGSRLGDTNMLLLLTLLLLSPNYPWYFLVVTPFLALCGSPATWVVSILALLLSEQLDWDFYIPRMVTKSILFGGLLLAWTLMSYRTRTLRSAESGVPQ
jgi:alpha-1,6-mannosyltransferase